MGKSLRIVYFQLILVVFSWGGAFTAAKIALQELPPFTVATLRFGLATLILIPFLWKHEGLVRKITRQDYFWFVLLGLTGVFGYNGFFYEALKLTTAVNGALIIAANPMAIVLLSALLSKEKLSRRQLIGILISFTGVLFVIAKGSLTVVRSLSFNFGDLLLIGAIMCWAIYTNISKRVMGKFSPLAATTLACAIGTLALAPFMIREILLNKWPATTWTTWVAISYIVVFATVMGFVWWNQGVAKIGASRAGIFMNLVPISAMLVATLFGEVISLPQLLGAMLVISGVYITSVAKKTKLKEEVKEVIAPTETIQI